MASLYSVLFKLYTQYKLISGEQWAQLLQTLGFGLKCKLQILRHQKRTNAHFKNLRFLNSTFSNLHKIKEAARASATRGTWASC